LTEDGQNFNPPGGVRAATPLSTKPSSRSVPDRSANAEVSLIRLCLVPTASCTFYLLPSSCRPPPRTLSPRRSFKFRPSISLFLLSSDDLTQEGLTCPTSQLRWSSSVAPGPRGLTLSPSSNNDSPFSDFACITTLGRLNIVPASQLRWNFRVALSVSGTGAP
jgi:hypothetical protein